jgi:hypothetical protein
LENKKANKKQDKYTKLQFNTLYLSNEKLEKALHQFQGPHNNNVLFILLTTSSRFELQVLAQEDYIEGCSLKSKAQLFANFKKASHLDLPPFTLSLSTINHCKFPPK